MSAFTLDDLTKLEKAMATGALVVKYKSGEVTYRSLKEMKEIRAEMRRDLGLTKSVARINMKTSKGV